MNKSVVLISKDILMPDYLPTYGNRYYDTPNISELASKGTVFNRHYTSAPSTAMAFTSMCTGKYPYELPERRNYSHVNDMQGQETIFDAFSKIGYNSHIIWSNNYNTAALPYSNCYSDAKIHSIDMNQPVGPHFKGMNAIARDEKRARETLNLLYREIDDIFSDEKDVFLWLHLPHVILGRVSYGDDIDLLDEIVGYIRKKVSDENIFITADHGNMNASKGKYGYGFDVYESAIRIPLITPRLEGKETVKYPTSNVDLISIILKRECRKREHIISDSAYFAQPRRKTAVIRDDIKLIYDKYNNSYEMYNVKFDPQEDMNLLVDRYLDTERNVYYNSHEVYFYPYWDRVDEEFKYLKGVLAEIWKTGTFYEEKICKYKHYISNIKRKLVLLKNKAKFRK